MYLNDGPIVQAEHTFNAEGGNVHNHSLTPNPTWQEGPALIQLDRVQNDAYGERDISEIELVP